MPHLVTINSKNICPTTSKAHIFCIKAHFISSKDGKGLSKVLDVIMSLYALNIISLA